MRLSRKIYLLLLPLIGLLQGACGGNGSAGHFPGDTIYRPEHAAYLILCDQAGNRLVVPDTAGGYSFLSPLYIGSGDAPRGVQAISSVPQRIVCMSSTHLAMLSALGMADRIVGVSGLQYISDPEIIHRQPADVGPGENVDYELLLSLDPDLVMLYGIGAPSPMQSKLDELGIPYIYLNEFTEQTPLGKSEWLVAVAEICGEGDRGRKLYADIAERYEAIKESTADVAVRPKVMLNTPYNGSWFMPAGNSYMVQLISDAGGDYVYPNDNTSSRPLDIEEAYRLASEADVWINVDNVSTLTQLKSVIPKFAEIKAVNNGRVWASTKRSSPGGGNDFYESAVVYPNRVLADLHCIMTGGDDSTTTYYQRLR